MKRYSLVLLFVLIGFILNPSTCYAASEPDSVSLSGIIIFEDVIDTGDALAYVPYDIPYTSLPDENIDEAYIFRILDSNGVEQGSALAYPYDNQGYGNGVVSFYLTGGLNSSANYTFRVQQNPVVYPSAQYWDFNVDNSNFSTSNNTDTAIKAAVVDSATLLSITFDLTLLEQSEAGTTVLSSYGEDYFLSAIPGLQSMSPSLFSIQLENPDYTRRSWSYTLSDSLKTKYSGTFVYDFMTGYAGLFNTTTTAAMNVLCMVIFTAVIILSVWKLKGTMMSSIVDAYVVLLLLMLMGFADMIMVGVMAFISSAAGGVILFLNRS